jgi:hypothetical protein
MSFRGWLRMACVCAVAPAALFCWNLTLYREPPEAEEDEPPPRISVLIPARNEEANIGAAVESVLGSSGANLELIVLDDGSRDRTAEIVGAWGKRDARVRCVAGEPVAPGWAGKAHACHLLAGLARHEVLCFVDADVRLGPGALARMGRLLRERGAALVSGFPHEETETALEWLLLPLIHFLLLGYLPLAGMRAFERAPGFAAGCGQFLMVRREAYWRSGGYSSVRETMHDGMTLSKLFRKHGFRTDLADLTELAECRMYRSAGEVWNGLLKNATEGLAAPGRIVPFTVLLFCGQVLPWLLLPVALRRGASKGEALELSAAMAASLLPRVLAVRRFRQPIRSVVLHPLGVSVLLGLQWYALARKLLGRKVIWKERAFCAG